VIDKMVDSHLGDTPTGHITCKSP